jgi:hypothetical protein
MTDAPADGLEALANRVQRAKRSAPPPRHPRALSEPRLESSSAEGPTNQASGRKSTSAQPEPSTGDKRLSEKSAEAEPRDALLKALPDAPTVMLGARVRVPLDDLLTDLVHEARRHQVKTSKVELVELALLSLVGVDGATIADRVRDFRTRTGRYMVRR